MTLKEWVAKQGRGALTRIQESTGLAYSTVLHAVGGNPIEYATAKKISAATGGEVTVADLLEPAAEPEQSERAAS